MSGKLKNKRETSSVRIARNLRNHLKRRAVDEETTIGRIIEGMFDSKGNHRTADQQVREAKKGT